MRSHRWLRSRVAGVTVCSWLLSAGQAFGQSAPAEGEPAPSAEAPATEAGPGTATPPAPLVAPPPPPAPPPAPAVADTSSPITGRLYGFIEERVNATFGEPNGQTSATGRALRSDNELDMSLPGFHLMGQGSLYSRFRYYFNLTTSPKEDIDDPTRDVGLGLRNAWVEASLFGDYLNLRAGKLYRRFGLYNEILDTAPSFIGVELPVVFGVNRPMLTRTTNAMLHGKISFDESTISYAATVGKDEISPADDVFSPGFDVNYDYDSLIVVGTSYYTTAGVGTPHLAPGEGSPAGAIAPWLASDRYQVYGGYARVTPGNFLLHAEAWFSPHVSTRDPARVLATAAGAEGFSDANRARMGVPLTSPTEGAVITDARYTYSTINVRAAYTFTLGGGADPVEITPFVNWEYVRNTESIADENFGGDGEPGHSTRGIMLHNRVGCVVKPIPQVAIKTEATHAMYAFDNAWVSNAELWLSLSYQFELARR